MSRLQPRRRFRTTACCRHAGRPADCGAFDGSVGAASTCSPAVGDPDNNPPCLTPRLACLLSCLCQCRTPPANHPAACRHTSATAATRSCLRWVWPAVPRSEGRRLPRRQTSFMRTARCGPACLPLADAGRQRRLYRHGACLRDLECRLRQAIRTSHRCPVRQAVSSAPSSSIPLPFPVQPERRRKKGVKLLVGGLSMAEERERLRMQVGPAAAPSVRACVMLAGC